jgi:hypothetical protein
MTYDVYELNHAPKLRRGDKISFTCEGCGVRTTRTVEHFKPGRLFCRSCLTMLPEVRDKYKKTCKERHGTECPVKGTRKYGSRRSRYYEVDGVRLDSKLQLRFYLSYKEQGLFIQRARRRFTYASGKHMYTDFRVEKGYVRLISRGSISVKDVVAREECCRKHNIVVLYARDVQSLSSSSC